MPTTVSSGAHAVTLRKLDLQQVKRLDILLEQVGDFGSVTLVVEKGVVKFVKVTVSKRL